MNPRTTSRVFAKPCKPPRSIARPCGASQGLVGLRRAFRCLVEPPRARGTSRSTCFGPQRSNCKAAAQHFAKHTLAADARCLHCRRCPSLCEHSAREIVLRRRRLHARAVAGNVRAALGRKRRNLKTRVPLGCHSGAAGAWAKLPDPDRNSDGAGLTRYMRTLALPGACVANIWRRGHRRAIAIAPPPPVPALDPATGAEMRLPTWTTMIVAHAAPLWIIGARSVSPPTLASGIATEAKLRPRSWTTMTTWRLVTVCRVTVCRERGRRHPVPLGRQGHHFRLRTPAGGDSPHRRRAICRAPFFACLVAMWHGRHARRRGRHGRH